MKLFKALIILVLLNILWVSQSLALSVIDSISVQNKLTPDDLFVERIIKVSPSQRIFVITNENGNIRPGDYISILKAEDLVARALVAKQTDQFVGIKILQIYSTPLWQGLSVNQDIQLIRGDDSYYSKKVEGEAQPEEGDSDDLTKEIVAEDDILSTRLGVDLEEKGTRSIKTDNIITVNYGLLSTAARRINHWGIQWAYQLFDNFWAEAQYGQGAIKEYPAEGLDTSIKTYSFLFKYTVNAPFYSYAQPFIGYKIQTAASPNAGVSDGVRTEAELQTETDDVEELQKNSVIFGLSILKRLVPGWFLKFDISPDLLNAGFSFEF